MRVGEVSYPIMSRQLRDPAKGVATGASAC